MIDTHAHLYMFEDDGREIVENMKNDNLQNIVTIGTNVEDSKKNIEIAKRFDDIYATVGIYPEFAESITDDDLAEIERLAQDEKVVAIGEIGLDFHSENYNKQAQIDLFIKQLKIADKLGLPFCIHCRKAGNDLYKILKENKHLIRHSGIMHCYSEAKDFLPKFLDLGLYISFSGNITYKNRDRTFLKNIPVDRILVETDSPYLSPEPLRGRVNEPKNVKYVVEKIATEIGMSSEEFDKIITENAKKVYFKIK